MFVQEWVGTCSQMGTIGAMMLRFQVSNHRSILDPVELSLIAVDDDRTATRGFERLPERVLTVAGIYGPNASGKTNVLDAIAWLSNAVARSLRGWEEEVPRDPHRFGDAPTEPSVFDLDLVVRGVRYTYWLEVDDSGVQYESLFSYPERRRRTLFEREGESVEFRRGFEAVRGIRELLTPTTLTLAAAVRLRSNPALEVGRAISRMSVLGLRRRRPSMYPLPRHRLADSTFRLFLERQDDVQHESINDNGHRRSALELLRWADPGIEDVTAEEDAEQIRQLQFIRQLDSEPATLDIEDESDGTMTWFRMLGPVLGTLGRGEVLLCDEIDASLHPLVSARLIELFQDPTTNPSGAQLIFTTHDTTLLNSLNRDEVWLTEKTKGLVTSLRPLAQYSGERVRKSVNLERAYLQGRFGAVPEIDQIAVREAIGISHQSS